MSNVYYNKLQEVIDNYKKEQMRFIELSQKEEKFINDSRSKNILNKTRLKFSKIGIVGIIGLLVTVPTPFFFPSLAGILLCGGVFSINENIQNKKNSRKEEEHNIDLLKNINARIMEVNENINNFIKLRDKIIKNPKDFSETFSVEEINNLEKMIEVLEEEKLSLSFSKDMVKIAIYGVEYTYKNYKTDTLIFNFNQNISNNPKLLDKNKCYDFTFKVINGLPEINSNDNFETISKKIAFLEQREKALLSILGYSSKGEYFNRERSKYEKDNYYLIENMNYLYRLQNVREYLYKNQTKTLDEQKKELLKKQEEILKIQDNINMMKNQIESNKNKDNDQNTTINKNNSLLVLKEDDGLDNIENIENMLMDRSKKVELEKVNSNKNDFILGLS